MTKIFWQNWPLQIKVIYWALLLLTLVSIAYFAFTYYFGLELVIDWRTAAYFEQIPMLLDSFGSFPFAIQPEAENLLILQNFEASPMEVNTSASLIFLLLSCLGFIFLLSIASYLPRLPFFLSMGVWILILSTVRFELLRFDGLTGQVPLLIVSALSVIPAFYFNTFNTRVSFILRLFTFFAVFAILGISIHFLSGHPFPLMYLASGMLVPMLLLTTIFLLIIAHEIMAAFVYVLTSSTSPGSKNHIHFIIISLIYLVNLVILYLHHIEKVEWNIWYINPYLLLVVSFALGLWGYRQREEQYQHIFSFNPLGAFFYLALSIIGFSTIGFFLGTANDPALEVIEEGIIYGHLGFGIIFLLYILTNFSTPLSQGLKVHKILYKPERMPYFMFRFAGLVAVFALVIAANWVVPFNYTFGAYFNQQGDLAKVSEESLLEQGFYQQSRIYAYQNHHANYNLANYFEKRDEHGRASTYYLNIMDATPSAQAYINLGNIYKENNRYFDALFALKRGSEELNSGHIDNNLALLYSRTDIIDSAIYFLDEAMELADTKDVAQANMEAIAAANGISDFIDSLNIDDTRTDVVTINNKIVRYNQQRRFFGAAPDIISAGDSLNFFAAGVTYNYLLNTIFNEDTTGIAQLIDLANRFQDGVYHEKISFGQSISAYYHHNVQDAFRRLNALANESYTDAWLFFKTLGQWSLQQGAPDQAARFFRLAALNGDEESTALEMVSRILNHESDSVQQLLQLHNIDTANAVIINKMATASASGEEQEELLYYIKYHLPYFDTTAYKSIIRRITDNDLKADGILAYSKKLFNYGLTEPAITVFENIGNLPIRNKALYDEIVLFELKLLAAKGQLRGIASQINEQNIEFSFKEFPDKVFYAALMNAASGDTSAALHNFRWIAHNQPFRAFEVVTATTYIKDFSNDRYEVYNLLLNALELNPLSVRLLKAYILEAARLGLERYAENSLEELEILLSPADFQIFLAEYEGVIQNQPYTMEE